ncbi:uncharacterized protein NEMAJ01_1947 [Nematocida major]|uniref:uncharacterized protein n=1 Tax=Nematocida major TaxID=1912982 RepID=UPI002008EA63|nr:uncharacterized protein NEMAJ01_1947 [Nematocida major]KAH9387051.1 hypothetical protein NEMAJ01_1947 [Nematocida major]
MKTNPASGNNIAQWIIYSSAISAVIYGMYKYLKYARVTPEGLKDEGNFLYLEKDYQKALQKYSEALALIEEMGDRADTEVAKTKIKVLNNIGQVHFITKNYAQAREYAEKVLSIQPIHYNSFKRLAMLEELGQGHGGTKGLSILYAFLIVQKHFGYQKERKKAVSGKSEAEPSTISAQQDPGKKPAEEEKLEASKWDKVLSSKIEQLSQQKASEIEVSEDFSVSFVRLEELLCGFNRTLWSECFGSPAKADRRLLKWVEEKDYMAVVKHLDSTPREKCTSRGLFVAGCIRHIQGKNSEAVMLFDLVNNPFGEVLSLYIQSVCNMAGGVEKEKLLKVMNRKDPIIEMYLIQMSMKTGAYPGEYLANLIDMQNKEIISHPFIVNIKMQFTMGEHKEAQKTFNKALSLFPQDVNLLCAGVEMLSARIEEIMSTDKKASSEGIEASASCREEYAMLTNTLSLLAQKEFANSPRSAFFRYIGYNTLRMKEAAGQALDQAVSLDPYNSILLIQQGYARIDAGDASGLALFEQAAKLSGESAAETYKLLYTFKSIYLLQEHFPHVAGLALVNKAGQSSHK